MSSGRVYHFGCDGEFIVNPVTIKYECNACGDVWNGRDWKVAEYRPEIDMPFSGSIERKE
jgi:hypothetical protein